MSICLVIVQVLVGVHGLAILRSLVIVHVLLVVALGNGKSLTVLVADEGRLEIVVNNVAVRTVLPNTRHPTIVLDASHATVLLDASHSTVLLEVSHSTVRLEARCWIDMLVAMTLAVNLNPRHLVLLRNPATRTSLCNAAARSLHLELLVRLREAVSLWAALLKAMRRLPVD